MNVFYILTWKPNFSKTETFFKKIEYSFLVEVTRIKTHYFHTILSSQKSMLRQLEWEVQDGPITKNRVLPVTTLFFWKFCFSIRTSYKVLIWCTNHLNLHIHTLESVGVLFKGAFFLWVSLRDRLQISLLILINFYSSWDGRRHFQY